MFTLILVVCRCCSWLSSGYGRKAGQACAWAAGMPLGIETEPAFIRGLAVSQVSLRRYSPKSSVSVVGSSAVHCNDWSRVTWLSFTFTLPAATVVPPRDTPLTASPFPASRSGLSCRHMLSLAWWPSHPWQCWPTWWQQATSPASVAAQTRCLRWTLAVRRCFSSLSSGFVRRAGQVCVWEDIKHYPPSLYWIKNTLKASLRTLVYLILLIVTKWPLTWPFYNSYKSDHVIKHEINICWTFR